MAQGRRERSCGAARACSGTRCAPSGGPFALAIVGAALFSLMAVGGTVVLGRVTDDVLTPAFEAAGSSTARWSSAPSPSSPARRCRMVGVVLRRYFGQMAQRRMQVLWFKRVTDRYLGVPLRWFDEHPTGELLAHADADCERVDDGDAAPPVLARRGAAHRRVDGAARHRRLGAPRRRRRPVPRPGRPQQRLHEARRAAGRGRPGPRRRRVERRPRELRGRAAREDARARGPRGRPAAGAGRGAPPRAARSSVACGPASSPASTPSRTSAPSRCSGSAPGGCRPATSPPASSCRPWRCSPSSPSRSASSGSSSRSCPVRSSPTTGSPASSPRRVRHEPPDPAPLPTGPARRGARRRAVRLRRRRAGARRADRPRRRRARSWRWSARPERGSRRCARSSCA